jgi:acetoacetyl-CoA synthetase
VKKQLSPKHVPKHIAAVAAVPVNLNLKKMEILVRDLVSGKTTTSGTPLSNPESIVEYVDWGRALRAQRAKL